jgi:hypothetical protein
MSHHRENLEGQYQRDWLRRQQYKFRRGLITEEELAQAQAALQQMKDKPSRVPDLIPPDGPQSVRIPMDRMTELALEYLMGLDPKELNLDRKLEKTEMFRVAICRWAIERDWNPPVEL